MKTIKIFYSLETTGLDERKHGIHKLYGMVDIDGRVVEIFEHNVAPHPKALIDPAALKVSGVDELDLDTYPAMGVFFKTFNNMLAKYIDPFNPKQKAYLIGFGNASFHDKFLRTWYAHNTGSFGSWFWHPTIDAKVLAAQYLLGDRRTSMGASSFSVEAVANELSVSVYLNLAVEKAENPFLTKIWRIRSIYRIATGEETEL
jgi:DNA polymerase III subunit epsilon